MKRFLATLIMSCVLSIPVSAGQIPTDGSPAPPPNGTNPPTNITSPGEIPSGGFFDSISEATVSAILSALGLASI
jgi:hypothetical protein